MIPQKECEQDLPRGKGFPPRFLFSAGFVALLLGLGLPVHAADPGPAPSLEGAELFRADPAALALRVRFAGAADRAKLRVLFDVNGRDKGEPSTGADYMLEGATWYRHPEKAPAWSWQPVSQPTTRVSSNSMTCLIPRVEGFEKGGWMVESLNPDWSTADRLPKEGWMRFDYAKLPPPPPGLLEPPIANKALDLLAAEPRAFPADGRLCFQLRFAAPVDRSRLRILVDVDGPEKGLKDSGADYMVEGVNFFKHRGESGGWDWEPCGSATFVDQGPSLICILPEIPGLARFGWMAETTNPDWTTAKRLPLLGMNHADFAKLAPLDLNVRPEPMDLSALLRHIPASLSVRYADEFDKLRWQEDGAAPSGGISWKFPSEKDPLPLVLQLTDAASGAKAELVPAHRERAGPLVRWSGEALGVAWQVIAREEPDQGLCLTGRLSAPGERCLSLAVGCRLPLEEWTWHDDVRSRKPISRHEPCRNAVGSPYGAAGEQSLYPLGVISTGSARLAWETDPFEPRVFRIVADAERRFFGVEYELAATPKTLKFPGQATFRCLLHRGTAGGDSAFRLELRDFYRRYPAFFENRTPRAGLWMPFSNISSLLQPRDFGFAFHEGPRAEEVDYLEKQGILNLVYTEPWLYWLPLPREKWNAAQAIRSMKALALLGRNQPNEQAASAMLGAARKPDGSTEIGFMDTAWSAGARMEVSTDPELKPTPEAPLNRAMSEWRLIQRALADPRVDGVYLDSMNAAKGMDYNPAALAVTDHPCTFDLRDKKPGIAAPIGACKFTSALGRSLKGRGKFLMGNFPCWGFPFFMPFIDIPGEETCWQRGDAYLPMSETQLDYRRAISGQKPFGFLQAVRFDQFPAEHMERYFRDCLFWAFLPSCFSHDGVNEPYWSNAKWIERDRPFFKTFVPLIRRLAEAGWQPLPSATAETDALRIEQFGATGTPIHHFTLRNPQETHVTERVRFEGLKQPAWLVDPLTGWTDRLAPDRHGVARAEVRLSPRETTTRAMVREDALEKEIAFLEGWNSGGQEAASCRASLKSIHQERQAKVACLVRSPLPGLCAETNRVVLAVTLLEKSAWSAQEVAVEFGGGTWKGSLSAAKGKEASPEWGVEFPGPGASGPQWVTLRWNLVREGQRIPCTRVFQIPFVPRLEAIFPRTRIVGSADEARIPVRLRNFSTRPAAFRITWKGAHGDGSLNGQIPPEEGRDLELPIKGRPGASGPVEAVVESEGKRIAEGIISVSVLGRGDSLVRDTRVRLEVDSTYAGYSPSAIRDGVVDSANVSWDQAAWASDEMNGRHWVRFTFPEPVAVRQVRIFWNVEKGVVYASRRGQIVGRTSEGTEKVLAEFSTDGKVSETTVQFSPQTVRVLELVQPPGAGSEQRPNLLWLREIEVR